MRLRASLLRVLAVGALVAASPVSSTAAGSGLAIASATVSASGPVAPASDVAVLASTSAGSSASLSPWTGGIDLYRGGVFTTQKTWYWCTAATVQISRNIVFHRTDHSASTQGTYFTWMRRRDRYPLPLTGGVDAAGWTAGFAHFVDARYRLHTDATFDLALRSAVTNLRKANLPVALAVDRGEHAWLLTGFTATADPARTTRFTVTSVRIVGPLYGLQSKNGYDMPPDTRLTPAQLRRFFTPWFYAPIRMVWNGTYVSIQPSAPAAPATSTPRPTPTPALSRSPSPTGMATSSPSAVSSVARAPIALAAVSGSVPSAIAPVRPLASSATESDQGLPVAASDPQPVVPLVAAGLLLIVVAAGLRGRKRRSRTG